jgi:hypothetical protein
MSETIEKKKRGRKKGVPLSPEHRKHHSEAKIGVSLSAEHRANISKAMIGKKNALVYTKLTDEEKKQHRARSNRAYFLAHKDQLNAERRIKRRQARIGQPDGRFASGRTSKFTAEERKLHKAFNNDRHHARSRGIAVRTLSNKSAITAA